MKKKLAFSLVVILSATNLFAQAEDGKYLRSSLSMILLESDDFPNKDAVMSSWNNYPFPDKYNEHNIDTKNFNVDAMELSNQDLLDAGFLKDTLNNALQIMKAESALRPVKYLNDEKTLAVVLPSEKQKYQLKIDKVIKDNGIARQLVSSWFTRDGKFSVAAIQERGSYNASAMEADIAAGNVMSNASLMDAGKQLVQNTFVTFSKLNFFKNEPAAALTRDLAKVQLAKSMKEKKSPQMLIDKAMQGLDVVYEETKEGYSLVSKTWLYKLEWNDSIYKTVLCPMWNDVEKLNSTDAFNLEFVGNQYNTSLVTFKIGEQRTEEQLIDIATVRNMDNAFAKLQNKNDVFKPMIPVSSSGPIMAKIGMKEGISAGDKFEVLEMIWDEKAGQTTWKSVGKCSVDKKAPIWDNRYNLGDGPATDVDENPVAATQFKGSKKIQVGMLLKQLK